MTSFQTATSQLRLDHILPTVAAGILDSILSRSGTLVEGRLASTIRVRATVNFTLLEITMFSPCRNKRKPYS